MATTFPDSIQTFPTMVNMGSADVANVKNYQAAMKAGNFTLAGQYLAQISNASNKIITADYINTILDTIVALQNFYRDKYSPAYVVSSSQPVGQEIGDFWFQLLS